MIVKSICAASVCAILVFHGKDVFADASIRSPTQGDLVKALINPRHSEYRLPPRAERNWCPTLPQSCPVGTHGEHPNCVPDAMESIDVSCNISASNTVHLWIQNTKKTLSRYLVQCDDNSSKEVFAKAGEATGDPPPVGKFRADGWLYLGYQENTKVNQCKAQFFHSGNILLGKTNWKACEREVVVTSRRECIIELANRYLGSEQTSRYPQYPKGHSGPFAVDLWRECRVNDATWVTGVGVKGVAGKMAYQNPPPQRGDIVYWDNQGQSVYGIAESIQGKDAVIIQGDHSYRTVGKHTVRVVGYYSLPSPDAPSNDGTHVTRSSSKPKRKFKIGP